MSHLKEAKLLAFKLNLKIAPLKIILLCMFPVSSSQNKLTVSPRPFISPAYRQALEPYTEPESLELSDHKPPITPLAIAAPATTLVSKPNRIEIALAWLVAGVCMLVVTSTWNLLTTPPATQNSPAPLEQPMN